MMSQIAKRNNNHREFSVQIVFEGVSAGRPGVRQTTFGPHREAVLAGF